MKNFLILLPAILIAACNQPASNTTAQKSTNTDSLRTELMNTDKAWNNASLQKGYFHSRSDFVADDGIELSENEMPLVGKQAVTDYATSHSDSALKVQWVPLRAEIAASGDLGYTYGSYSNQFKTTSGKDTLVYGAYVTVWKKQPDGSWKFLADGGVSTPQEVK
jgi:ketosteroid isomerase-like protein